MQPPLRTTDAFTGVMTALVTPFRDGQIDWTALDELIEMQIDAGVDWLVPCGTTGESPTLTPAEQEQLIERVVDRASGRCRVLAGTGGNGTAVTIEKTRKAKQLGADAAMLVAPYYNRPPQEGLFRHYAAVAEAVDVPIVLYNVPARTGVHVADDTIVRLRARFPNIVAVKDASGVVDHVTELRRRCDIAVLCGDDALTWPMLALGASGVVSVVSNLTPTLMVQLVQAAQRGDLDAARRWHKEVFTLANELARFGPNPIPVKTALAILGMIAEEFRLPLCPVDDQARVQLAEALTRCDVRRPVHA